MPWKYGLTTMLPFVIAAMLGCGSDDASVPTDGNDLSGDWFRVGKADCHGSMVIDRMLFDQDFIQAEWLRVEQRDNSIWFYVEGGDMISSGEGYLEDGGVIELGGIGVEVSYGADVDEGGLYYHSASVQRRARLDDAMRIVFQDWYEARLLFPDRHGSYEHALFCAHAFARD